MDELILKIDGMSCGHCVGQVTKALTQLDSVQVRPSRSAKRSWPTTSRRSRRRTSPAR